MSKTPNVSILEFGIYLELGALDLEFIHVILNYLKRLIFRYRPA